MAINDTNNTIPAEHRLAAGRNFLQRNEKVRDFNTAEEDQIKAVAEVDATIPTAVQTALDLKQNLNAKLTTYVGTKIYRALLTQAGTAAPIATVLENTLSAAVVWTRTNAGKYTATLAGAFLAGKVVCHITNGTFEAVSIACARATDNTVTVIVFDITGAADADDYLSNASISIIVYP